MNCWGTKLAATFVLAYFASVPQVSQGAMWEGRSEGVIEGKEVSAHVLMRIVDGNLLITLTNTGRRSDYTPAQVLTDVSFDMPGVDFVVGDGSGSSVSVRLGSSLRQVDEKKGIDVTEEGPYDLSPEWGLARNVTLPSADVPGETLGPFDFSVSATSFGGTETHFASGNLGGPPSIDGSDYGLLSHPDNVRLPAFKNKPQVVSSVVITLSPVDPVTRDPLVLTTLDLLRIGNVVFPHGSAHTGIVARGGVTPEPSSLLVWALCPLVLVRRYWRRRKR